MKLFFDNGATIGHFNHITCVNSVHIGRKVLTADKVHISKYAQLYRYQHSDFGPKVTTRRFYW
jgi:acetyltransferase-like isoleucine patch superfamily enzyme